MQQQLGNFNVSDDTDSIEVEDNSITFPSGESADLPFEVDISHLVDRLEGRDGGLRPSKPTTDKDTGLTQYVWRMARFHGGYDTSMPVTASWWLSEYLDSRGIDASVSGVMDDEGKRITSELEKVVDEVLVQLGENPTRAAERYEGLLY